MLETRVMDVGPLSLVFSSLSPLSGFGQDLYSSETVVEDRILVHFKHVLLLCVSPVGFVFCIFQDIHL